MINRTSSALVRITGTSELYCKMFCAQYCKSERARKDQMRLRQRCMQEPGRSHCIRYPQVPPLPHATASSTAGAGPLVVVVAPVVPELCCSSRPRGRKELWPGGVVQLLPLAPKNAKAGRKAGRGAIRFQPAKPEAKMPCFAPPNWSCCSIWLGST